MIFFRPRAVTCSLLLAMCSQAQINIDTDSTKIRKADSSLVANKRTAQYHLTNSALIVPGILISYGFIAVGSHGLKNFNSEIEEEVYTEHVHKKVTIDNYLQFAPAIAVYALNAVGIKGEHNFRDRSMIYLVSNIIMNTSVDATKKLSHQLRPDSSAYNSFPSGHTAEAFASAEFMRLEYRDVSPWYGIAGYAIAATTGYLRMYNNRHWFSDVVAGAGIGILSTDIAYWLYPKFQHKIFKDKPAKTVVVPTYQSGSFGLSLAHKF